MLKRVDLAEKIQNYMAGKLAAEDLGWWAFDLIVAPDLKYEPGFERLIKDVIQAIHYFHDTDPIMRQFCPDNEDLVYFLKCLNGEEMYNPKRVPRWKV